jgi:hypothetical protein
MQDDLLKEGAAQKHHDPVAVESDGLAGRRNIIKTVHAMTEANPNGLQAKPENTEHFGGLKFPDIGQVPGKPGVHVVARNVMQGRGDVGRRADVAAKTIQHQLHHVALAVMRRRRMRKDKQFHADKLEPEIWAKKRE